MRLPSELQPAPRRWSLRDCPTFVEAYPALSIGEAHRQGRGGRAQLLWRNQKEHVTGAARIEWLGSDTLIVAYRIEEQTFLDEETGQISFDVIWKGSHDNNQRPFAACPLCRRHADIMVFVGVWCCGTKHGLRHRSAQLRKEVRWSEALTDVEGEIALDQHRGLAGGAHRARIAKRDLLIDRLGQRRVTANVLALAINTADWVQPVEVVAIT